MAVSDVFRHRRCTASFGAWNHRLHSARRPLQGRFALSRRRNSGCRLPLWSPKARPLAVILDIYDYGGATSAGSAVFPVRLTWPPVRRRAPPPADLRADHRHRTGYRFTPPPSFGFGDTHLLPRRSFPKPATPDSGDTTPSCRSRSTNRRPCAPIPSWSDGYGTRRTSGIYWAQAEPLVVWMRS